MPMRAVGRNGPDSNHMRRRRLWRDAGAALVEYVMLVVLIALVVLAAAWAFGDAVLNLFDGAGKSVPSAP